MLTLPDGNRISQASVTKTLRWYERAVFHFYDLPEGGPHDKVLPIDLLSLNALNVWGRSQPMTAMTNGWSRRAGIERAVGAVSREPLEKLTAKQRNAEAEKVAKAIERIDAIPRFGWTASTKLLHRMRPNLAPIWDSRMGNWYDSRIEWLPWIRTVYDHVLDDGTRATLSAARKHLEFPRLSLLRMWDILLWLLAE